MQSADIIFNPDSDNLRLMLARTGRARGEGRRSYSRRRVVRKQGTGPIEAHLEWTSWHGGDGFGRVPGVGRMPPLAADGPLDSRWQHMLLLPPAVTQVTSSGATIVFEHGGRVWTNDGSTLKSYNSAGVEQSSTALGAAPVGFARFDGSVWIGIGLSNNAWKIDSSNVITQAASASVRWNYLATAQTKLYFSTAATVVRSVTTGADPFTTGNWSGNISTGNTGGALTALSALGRVLFLGRQDGLNAFDQSLNVVNQIPDLDAYRSANNCVGMTPWHGGLLVPHERGLFWYTEGIVTPVGPERIKTNGTFVNGRFTALAADGEWVFGTAYAPGRTSGNRTILYAARERGSGEPGEGPLAWFMLGEWAATAAQTGIAVTTFAGSPRLYFCDGTGRLLWIPLPDTGYAPTSPGTGSFETSGYVMLPHVDMEQPMVSKYLKSVEVDVDNASTTNTVQVAYALNPTTANPTFTNLGTLVKETGRTELAFPVNTVAREVQIKLTLAGSATSTPIVRRVALNYAERAKKVTIHQAVVVLTDGQAGSDAYEMSRDPEAVLDQLYEYEAPDDSSAQHAQTLITPSGSTKRVLLLDLTVAEGEDDTERPGLVVTLTMQEVP